jgi:hypothetical protein
MSSTTALDDLLTGAITHGVNYTTFAVLNVLLFFAVLSIAGLLVAAAQSAPALVPHAAFLLALALLLWAAITWFVLSAVGLADPQAQRRQLLQQDATAARGGGGEGDSTPQQQQSDEAAAAVNGSSSHGTARRSAAVSRRKK